MPSFEQAVAGLDQYQIDGVEFLAGKRGAILADEMGLGKTPQAIRAADFCDAKQIVVVAKKSLLLQWSTMISAWTIGDASVSLFTTKTKQWPTSRWVISNYESIMRKQPADFPKSVDILIVDEAHALKNRKAKRTKATKLLAKRAGQVWLLTGTPMRNHPEELWSLLNCVDPKRFSSYWKWIGEYFETKFNGWANEVVGLREESKEAFGQMLGSVLLRREKGVVDLPPLTFETVYVEMAPKQTRIYRSMKRDMLVMLGGGEGVLLAPSVLAQLTRLRQIADDPRILPGGEPHDLDSGKTEWILEHLMELAEDRQIILFSVYAGYINLLAEMLDGDRIGVVTGAQTVAEREQIRDQFQAGKKSIVLGTYDAMGEGMNLQAGSLVILVDLPWTPDQFDQAVSRAHRRNQQNPVHVISLLSAQSVDLHVRSVLDSKEEIIDEALAVRRVLRSIREEGQ